MGVVLMTRTDEQIKESHRRNRTGPSRPKWPVRASKTSLTDLFGVARSSPAR